MSENIEEIKNNEMDEKLEKILQHDFSSDQEFDLESNYKLIEGYKNDITLAKNNEAENIIKDSGPLYLNQEYQDEMNKIKDNFYALVRKYDPNKDIIKSMDESGKNKIYAIVQFMVNSYINMLNNLLFNINWTREEYKFIKNTFRSRIEYSGNELFNTMELKDNYLDKWEDIDKKLPKTIDNFTVTIDIRNIVMMYHFLGAFKIKGMTDEYYTFINILQKIADTNKIYNAYNIVRERIQMDFMNWSGALDPMVNVSEDKTQE